jgi:hypothetical protein
LKKRATLEALGMFLLHRINVFTSDINFFFANMCPDLWSYKKATHIQPERELKGPLRCGDLFDDGERPEGGSGVWSMHVHTVVA